MGAVVRRIASVDTAAVVVAILGAASYAGWYTGSLTPTGSYLMLLAAITCGVIVIVGHDVSRRIEARHEEREAQWWALVEMMTEDRSSRLDVDLHAKALAADVLERHHVTVYPWKSDQEPVKLKPEDSPDAS